MCSRVFLACVDYTSFDSNGENGSLKVRRDSPAALIRSVDGGAVNCAPWSELKISGVLRPSAVSSASRQNWPSTVTESSQAKTLGFAADGLAADPASV